MNELQIALREEPAVRKREKCPIGSRAFRWSLLTLVLGLCAHAQVAAQLATTTQLSVSGPSVAWPSPVTFTAKVAASGTPVMRGLVTFCQSTAAACQGPAVIGTAQLGAGGTASLKLVLGIGPHSVKAVFAGTTAAAPSTS